MRFGLIEWHIYQETRAGIAGKMWEKNWVEIAGAGDGHVPEGTDVWKSSELVPVEGSAFTDVARILTQTRGNRVLTTTPTFDENHSLTTKDRFRSHVPEERKTGSPKQAPGERRLQ